MPLFIWKCAFPFLLQWLNDSWIFCLKASCLYTRNKSLGCRSSGFWQLPDQCLVCIKNPLFPQQHLSQQHTEGTDSCSGAEENGSAQFWCLCCCCCSHSLMDVFVREDGPVHLCRQCLAINHLPQMCVFMWMSVWVFFPPFSFCGMDEECVWFWQLINQHQCSSPVGNQNAQRTEPFRSFKTIQRSTTAILIQKLKGINFTREAMEMRTLRPNVLKGFPAIAMATDWLIGGTFSRSSSVSLVLFLLARVSET